MTDRLPPPAHTPLSALPALVLDLETTGLDVRNDRVVQVAAVAMLGSRIEAAPLLDSRVNPGVPIPAEATRIHGIADADVAGAPRFPEIAARLHQLFAGRLVIGHHIGFDLAVLRHEAARAGLPWHEPVMLDIAQLVGALYPALPDLSLETVATNLGVEISGRHSAIGDCRASAEAWARLLPLLRDAHLRTLGEVQSYAARRDDLELHQAQLGWYATPGEIVPLPAPPAPGRIDSYAFTRRLDELMSAPPAMIAPDRPLLEAARTMVERRIGALLVGRAEAVPQGIVTERDLLRAAADRGVDMETTPLSTVMSSPVEAMPGDELLYRALGRMDRVGIRHLCVVNPEGIAIGVVSQRDLLHHRARGVDMIEDALEEAHDTPALAAAYARLPDIAGGLVSEGLGGLEVARVISVELRTLTARVAHLVAARLVAEGHGPAPAPWCVMVLGSGGRGESLLGADQDNALVHAGTPDDDPWFAALGAGMAEMLDEAGVPRCQGGVMVASREWRGNGAEWRARLQQWLDHGSPDDLINIDIFFDMAPVAGDPGLARALRHEALQAAAHAPLFLSQMALFVNHFTPRLGMFGRLPVKDGRIDLKRDGLLPLVSFARCVALRVGSTACSTPERLLDVMSDGRLPEGDAHALLGLHKELMTLALNQQLLDLDEGVRPSGRVAVKGMSRRMRSRLGHGLRRLDEIVNELPGLISG